MLLRNLGKTAVRVTEIGFGAAPLGNLFAVVTEQDAQASLKTSWDSGCRFFDTAPLYGYGLSERRVGDALREKPRDQYVLSTKVGRLLRPGMGRDSVADFQSPMPFHAEFDYSYDATMRSFEDSLAAPRARSYRRRADPRCRPRLARRPPARDVPQGDGRLGQGADEAEGRAGTIGAIGVGLNEADVCEDALNAADFDCFLLAGRYTLLEQGPLDRLFPACQQAERLHHRRRRVQFRPAGAARAAGRDLQLRRGPAGDRQARGRAARGLRASQRAAAGGGPAVPARRIRSWPSVIPGARNAAEVASHWQWARLKIPAALWEDLRGRGLLHPEAPVPQGPIL